MSWFASVVAWKIAYERKRIVAHQQALSRWEAWYAANAYTDRGVAVENEVVPMLGSKKLHPGEHRREMTSMYVNDGDTLVYREGCFDPASTQILRIDATLEAAHRLEEHRQEAGVFEDTKPQMLRLCGITEVDVDLSSGLFGFGTQTDKVSDSQE